MKKCFLSFITITIMFFFNNVAKSDYEKIFYDFNIESINGELIDFIFELSAMNSILM